MAKKRRKAVKSYFKGGGTKNIISKEVIDGGLAGFGGQIAQKWLGPWSHPAATLLVGMWQGNKTLQTEGARELGAMIATMIPVIGGGTSPYSGGGRY